MSVLSRYLASSKNGLLWMFVTSGSLLLLWGFRMPGGDVSWLCAGLILVFIAALFVIVRILVRLVLLLKQNPDLITVWSGWTRWLICMVVTSTIVLIGVLGVPSRLAFALSRPKLEGIVESAQKGQAPKGDFWVALYPIKSITPIDGGFQFTFRKAEILWGEGGLYYSASGEPIDDPHFYDQKRIGSKWFSWHYGGW